VLRVRPIEDDDIPAVIGLWEKGGNTRPWNDPTGDIALARDCPSAEILVGLEEEQLIAAVMVGFDGHRGWVYYVTVDPDARRQGNGRTIMAHAETWLKRHGCLKIQLMIRHENTDVQAFYRALGYAEQRVDVVAKWLEEPPAAHPDFETAEHGAVLIPVTVTWLEMTGPPKKPPVPLPTQARVVSLLRLEDPTVSYWRFLYAAVGEPWFWWEKRAQSDEEVGAVIGDERVEVYVLSVGNTPAGFIQLDCRGIPEVVDVAYFGLVPEFIGRGLGQYLLDWGVRAAWHRDPAPWKLTVNTCTLDHPAAVAAYQRAGFTPVRQATVELQDPRLSGYLPADLPLPPHYVLAQSRRSDA